MIPSENKRNPNPNSGDWKKPQSGAKVIQNKIQNKIKNKIQNKI